MADAVVGGIYRHCKGGVYQVIAIARDSSNPQQEMVVYQDTKGPQAWIRKRHEFEGAHETGVERFQRVT